MFSLRILILCAFVVFATFSFASDTSSLKPPAGANVAIVEFIDLQCPDCAAKNPLVKEAAKTYNIPIIRHDFPLPKHNWSGEAAVIAKYFDSKSKALGFAWRDYCFENQPAITPDNLRGRAEKFATQNGTSLPFVVDPDGKFAKEIKEDFAFGERVGIQHTPTIYVVSTSTTKPVVEVTDPTQLYAIIDQAKTEAGANTATPAKSPARKTSTKGSTPAKIAKK